MPNVEIIYLKNKENNQKRYNSRDTLIEKSQPRKIKNINHSINKDTKNKKRKTRFYTSIFIAFFIISTILVTSYNTGYLPVNSLLEIKEPSGRYTEIKYSEIERNYPITNAIPEIKDIKNKLYESDENIRVISENYKKDLLNEGYKLEYNGVENIKGINVHYYGYIKGITAVVILITSDNIDTFDSDTLVLYSTGNIFSYKNIIDRYSSNFKY